MLARDREFIYFGGIVEKSKGFTYQEERRARPRDPDLIARDRIEFSIDTDRDVASAFKLTIDYRGWVAESIFNDPSWDPEWYVAARQDEFAWYFEAAMPLSQLHNRTDETSPWYFGVRRIIPEQSTSSWPEKFVEEKLPQMGVLYLSNTITELPSANERSQ